MDHPAPSPELVRPWRLAAMVAVAIAAVELVLLVVAGVALLGRSLASHAHKAPASRAAAPTKHEPAKAAAAPSATPGSTGKATVLPRARTQVMILNGNGVQGAAAEAASLVKARGYPVKDVRNAPRTNYARTFVMYRPGLRPEALRFRHDLNTGVVTPLDGLTPRQLHGAQLVLILGAGR